MKTIMKRIWIFTMLTCISSVAWAQKVDLNDSYTGGTVEVTDMSDPADDGSVVVTLTVTPDEGYVIGKDDILVIPTIASESSMTRDGKPQIADQLEVVEMEGEDYSDLTKPHNYTFTIPAGLGAWVKEANFHTLPTVNDISGDEKSNVVWSYDPESKSINITGTGSICDFDGEEFTDPWAEFRATIESVLIGKEVTSLGANVFAGCTNLTIITVENSTQVLVLGKDAIPEGVDINVPGNLYSEYMMTEGWKDLSVISKEAVEIPNIEFGQNNQYVTFVSNDQDLVVPSVLYAYVISGVNEEGLVLTQVNVIPAGIPVLLFSKELKGSEFYTAATEAEPMRAANLLKVAPEGGLEVSLGEVFILYNDVFYYAQAGTIPEGRVYLTNPSPEKTRASYSLGGQGDTTGIDASYIYNMVESPSAWYGLDGRQYTTMPTRKGIYIKDGKKVVIK